MRIFANHAELGCEPDGLRRALQHEGAVGVSMNAVSQHRHTIRVAVRKALKWGGAIVVLLLIAAWIGLLGRHIRWTDGKRFGGGVGEGQVIVYQDAVWASQDVRGFHFTDQSANPTTRWWPSYKLRNRGSAGRAMALELPLWMLAVLAMLISVAAWRSDVLAIRRARKGCCVKCGYDRQGIAATTRCPECGAEPALPRQSPLPQ